VTTANVKVLFTGALLEATVVASALPILVMPTRN
jgi:hypothetical protein